MVDNGSGGATAVIAHRVLDSQHADYERWLERILPLVAAAPGFLDVQVIRPVRGLTDGYTVILRFDSEAGVAAVAHIACASGTHRLGASDPRARRHLHAPHGNRLPVRAPGLRASGCPCGWKQFLVTWTAILPLSFALPPIITPLLRLVGWDRRFVVVTTVSAAAVFLMVLRRHAALYALGAELAVPLTGGTRMR